MKIHIKTWGCTAAQSDSEIMAGLLAKERHKLVPNERNADIVILNTCTVKHRVEIDELKEIERLKKRGKKIIVTGCLVQDGQHFDKLKGISLIGLNDQDKIVKYVKVVANGKVIRQLSAKKIDKTNLPVLRTNPVIEKIQLATGCASECTYCATKLAKGNIYSFSEARILARIKAAINDGVREIWLTSQDNGAYGLDRGTNLASLLEKICAINGDFFIRVGMTNPQWVKKFLPQMIEAYKNPKVFKFLHIPVQSGSNKVLRDMARGYSVEDFKSVIKVFRKKIPNLTISTDIICGYPTETEADWEKTIELVKWLRPDVINISQFWPRPGTAAAKLKQLGGDIKKERSRTLTKLYQELALMKNKSWIGWRGKVLVDEKGQKGGFIGRNFAYKPIILKSKIKLKLGTYLKVKIVGATQNYLIGEIC
ncbi:MAG: tRNA (N(6)-L-threonylcarbamoyladenosine(37)-C(2))-methylthiotransferase [Candidatus Nanoarchaeia archaeon]